MFRHNLRKRGVAMVEYAVLLAFVTAIGGLFMDDSKLNSAISDVVDKVTYMVANGKSKPAYRYDVQTRPEDAKYKLALDSLINGLYDELSKDGNPLKYVYLYSDGSVKNYRGYADTAEHKYAQGEGPNIRNYLPSEFQFDTYRGETKLFFTENGMISNNVYGSNEVFLTDRKTPYNFITFNEANQDFGFDKDYRYK